MAKKPDKTAAEREARYHAKRMAEGFSRVCVWVPADKREEIKAYAAKLRGDK